MMVELNNSGTEDTHSITRTALIVPSVFAHVQHTDHRGGTTVGECKQSQFHNQTNTKPS